VCFLAYLIALYHIQTLHCTEQDIIMNYEMGIKLMGEDTAYFKVIVCCVKGLRKTVTNLN